MRRRLNPLTRRRALRSRDLEILLEVGVDAGLFESRVREDGQVVWRLSEYGRGLDMSQLKLEFDADLRKLTAGEGRVVADGRKVIR